MIHAQQESNSNSKFNVCLRGLALLAPAGLLSRETAAARLSRRTIDGGLRSLHRSVAGSRAGFFFFVSLATASDRNRSGTPALYQGRGADNRLRVRLPVPDGCTEEVELGEGGGGGGGRERRRGKRLDTPSRGRRLRDVPGRGARVEVGSERRRLPPSFGGSEWHLFESRPNRFFKQNFFQQGHWQKATTTARSWTEIVTRHARGKKSSIFLRRRVDVGKGRGETPLIRALLVSSRRDLLNDAAKDEGNARDFSCYNSTAAERIPSPRGQRRVEDFLKNCKESPGNRRQSKHRASDSTPLMRVAAWPGSGQAARADRCRRRPRGSAGETQCSCTPNCVSRRR